MKILYHDKIYSERSDKEKTLREYNKKLKKENSALLQTQTTVDQHAIISVTNLLGEIIFANEQFYTVSKYSKEEVLGNTHRIINSGFHSKDFFRKIFFYLKHGLTWQGEIKNKAKDGSYFWVSSTITPVKDSNGEVYQYFAVQTNITNIKLKEEQLEAQCKELKNVQAELIAKNSKFLEFYNLSPVGFFTLNENGIILDANLTISSFLNNNTDSIVNEPILKYISNKDKSKFNSFRNELYYYNRTQSCELRMLSIDDHEFWVKLDAVPCSEKKDVLISKFTVTKITKFKEKEKELRNKIKVSNKRNISKDKLLSIIAHDLINPFVGILGISDLLESRILNSKSEDSRTLSKYINLIRNGAKSSLALLENLLFLARNNSDSSQIRLREIQLNDQIKHCISVVNVNAFKKNITIETELAEMDKVLADEFFLNTVLRNLMTNAIKFTNPGGVINIATYAKEEFLEISIEDNGIGIDKEYLKKIFRIDYKSNKFGTENEKGTGLGLILCKEFIEKMGGKIWAESEIGKGSKFTFILPLIKKKKESNKI